MLIAQKTPTKSKLISIPGGVAGIRATLKIMGKVVKESKKNYEIRNLVLSLVRNLAAKNWLAEVRVIFNYIHSNIRYVKDIDNIETIATPEKTLEIGQGDCDDMAVLAAAMLQSIGHPTRFVAVGFGQAGYSHVMVETMIGTRWIPLELTADIPLGKEPANIGKRMIQHMNLSR